MIPLQIKFKKTKGSNYNYIILIDDNGYEIHRIIAAFDENFEKGFDGKWRYKDAYLENNRVWITKFKGDKERKVSYPIKKTNKYYKVK